MKNGRLVIDLDGVICELKQPGQSYAEVQPIRDAIESLKLLKQNGYYIIVNTARNMKTCNANEGMVLKNVGAVTLNWLNKHQVPYDEIYFGKPWANLYIDDNGYRFTNWKQLIHDIQGITYSEDVINIIPDNIEKDANKLYDLKLQIADMTKQYLSYNSRYDLNMFLMEVQQLLRELVKRSIITKYYISEDKSVLLILVDDIEIFRMINEVGESND